MKDTNLGKAVIAVLKSDSVVSLGKEYFEIGIDVVIESGALKEIPFVNSLSGIFNAVGTVRDQLLTTKLIRFLSQLSEIPKEERIKMIDKLNKDDKFSGRAGATLIEVLDRMESEIKPELAAKCFIAYSKKDISFKQLRRMLFALERLPSFEIDSLKGFSKATSETSMKMDVATLLAFVNAGLGQNNGGMDGGAILPTELCKLFVNSGVVS